MSELHHECGVAAIYHLPAASVSPLCPEQGPEQVSRLMPRMLLDIQNRGQLSAGMTTLQSRPQPAARNLQGPGQRQRSVSAQPSRQVRKHLMERYAGRAAIGHVRYATCGADDRSYAQPFERHHVQKHKWFSFAFNGQLANYRSCATSLLADDDHHLARDTDTEIIMHEISRELSGDRRPPLVGSDAERCAAVRRGVQPRVAQRAGRHARGPRPAGHCGRCATRSKGRCSPRPARAWRC